MRNFFILLFFGSLFYSCQSNIILSETKTLKNGWAKNNPIEFTFTQPDSLQTYQIYLLVKNTNAYKYNNLFLIVSMEFPHGKTITDTLEYRMANPDGTWLGTGLGAAKENKLWYKENVRFPEKGNYKLIIQQAVRNNGEVDGVTNLEGIIDVGYSIEKLN